MANYTSAADIAAYLGTTFTAEQSAQADVAAAAITTWIDHRTGRSWQAAGAILDEQQRVQGTTIYLATPPVASVEQIEVFSALSTRLAWEVVDPSRYLLTDPLNGVVTIAGGYNGDTVRVDYTTDLTAPPADVAYAATMLAADVMVTTLHPESHGVESISVGQNDLTLRYANAGTTASSSSDLAVRVIDAYRRVVLA